MVPAGAPAVTLEGEGFETGGTVQLQVSKGIAFFNRVLFAAVGTLTTPVSTATRSWPRPAGSR